MCRWTSPQDTRRDLRRRQQRPRKTREAQPFLDTYEKTRSNAVVARSGRPHSIAREPLQDATMRSGRSTQAITGGNDEVGRTADPPSS